MTNEKSHQELDCVEMKLRIQAEIHEETKGMTIDQEIAYYQQSVDKGPFKKLWKSLKDRNEAEITNARFS